MQQNTRGLIEEQMEFSLGIISRTLRVCLRQRLLKFSSVSLSEWPKIVTCLRCHSYVQYRSTPHLALMSPSWAFWPDRWPGQPLFGGGCCSRVYLGIAVTCVDVQYGLEGVSELSDDHRGVEHTLNARLSGRPGGIKCLERSMALVLRAN